MSYGIKEKMVAEKLAALCLLLHFFYLSSFFFFYSFFLSRWSSSSLILKQAVFLNQSCGEFKFKTGN